MDNYHNYLQLKQEVLNKLFSNVNNIIPATNIRHYRNNSTLSLGQSGTIDQSCTINTSIIVSIINKWIDKHSSLNRKVWHNVKIRDIDNLIMIKLELKISNHDELTKWHSEKVNLLIYLLNKCQDINLQSIYYQINNELSLLTGQPYLIFRYNDNINLTIMTDNFVQINTEMMYQIYNQIDALSNSLTINNFISIGDDSGNICTIFHSKYKYLYGIIHSEQSYQSALNNNHLNQIANISYIHDPKLWSTLSDYDHINNLLVINPGRKGLGNKGIGVVNNLININNIIYMSCKIKTLRDDLSKLTKWRLITISPIDNFPFIDNYCENIVLLQKTI